MHPDYKKILDADAYNFDTGIDLAIINAHRAKMPFIGPVHPSLPIYRCYFFEDQILVTCLHHITNKEYGILSAITESHGFKPYIKYYVLYENRVIAEGEINASVLAHILFHFHHRIGLKYLVKDFLNGIF